jgi:hypothetical protein
VLFVAKYMSRDAVKTLEDYNIPRNIKNHSKGFGMV